jgi:hypothetical protein
MFELVDADHCAINDRFRYKKNVFDEKGRKYEIFLSRIAMVPIIKSSRANLSVTE